MALKSQYQVAVINNDSPVESGTLQTAVTFGASDTVSSVLNVGATSPTGIYTPDSWLACDLSFEVSKNPNGPFVPLTNFDGTPFVITSSAGAQCTPLLPSIFNSVALFLKLVSSVPQSGEPVVEFALAPIFQGLHS